MSSASIFALRLPPLANHGFVFLNSLSGAQLPSSAALKFQLSFVGVSPHRCRFSRSEVVLPNPVQPPPGGCLFSILFHIHPSPFNVQMPSSVTSTFPLHKQCVCIFQESQALIKVTQHQSQILELYAQIDALLGATSILEEI